MPDLRTQRAFATIETLVVSVALSLALAQVGPFGPARDAHAEQVAEAESEARRLRRKAAEERVDTSWCPSSVLIVGVGTVHPARDPWGKPYWTFCQGSDVTIVSDGPDGLPFTADDVGAPAVPWAAAPARARRSLLGSLP